MPTLTTLPEEILLHIFSFSDRLSLKSLRYTCHRISVLATEKLFQTILLRPHNKSIDRFMILANSDAHLTRIPRHIHFIPYEEAHYVIHDLDNPDAPNWGEAPSQMWKLPRLDSAMLYFSTNRHEAYYHPSDVGYDDLRHKIISDFFAAMKEMAPPPRKLAVGFIDETDTNVVGVDPVLRGLHTFRLGVLCRGLPTAASMEMPSQWLQPTAASLQRLDLTFGGDQPAWSIFDVSDVHFAQLRSLTLRGWTFVADAQVEWIVSHADTLDELVLEKCRILIRVGLYGDSVARGVLEAAGMKFRAKGAYPNRVESVYGTRWKDVFALFGERLGRLRRFKMGWRRRDLDGWCEDTAPVRNVLHQGRYAVVSELHDGEDSPDDAGNGRWGYLWDIGQAGLLGSKTGGGGGRVSQYQLDYEALGGLLRRIGDAGVVDGRCEM